MAATAEAVQPATNANQSSQKGNGRKRNNQVSGAVEKGGPLN